MNKEIIEQIGLWSLRGLLVLAAMICGWVGATDVGIFCILGLIASFLLTN